MLTVVGIGLVAPWAARVQGESQAWSLPKEVAEELGRFEG